MYRPAAVLGAALVLLILRFAGSGGAVAAWAQPPDAPVGGSPPQRVLLLRPNLEALPASANRRPITAETPDGLLARLASDRFVERQQATTELIRRGKESLPILLAGATMKDSEVAHRCLSLLLSQLDSKDAEVARAFRQELAIVAAESAHPFLAGAITREFQKRIRTTLQELTRSGAKVEGNGQSIVIAADWRGSKATLDAISWLSDVESLELRHPLADDSTLAHVAGLSRLRTLNLNRSTITAAGVEHLARLPKLETLLLQGVALDDSAVEPLSRLRGVKAMNLARTRLTPRGVERLRRKLRTTQILY